MTSYKLRARRAKWSAWDTTGLFCLMVLVMMLFGLDRSGAAIPDQPAKTPVD